MHKHSIAPAQGGEGGGCAWVSEGGGVGMEVCYVTDLHICMTRGKVKAVCKAKHGILTMLWCVMPCARLLCVAMLPWLTARCAVLHHVVLDLALT